VTQPFRIAFIGVDHPHGAGWRELLPHLSDEVAVTAVVPAFGGSVASLEERYAQVPRFDNVEALIARGEFDGAMVCLPNAATPETIIALAKAGKHVMIEKPGGESGAAFAPAADALRSAGVAFQIGYLWRHDPGADRLRAMIADGRFGKLISIEIGLFTSDVARRGPDHYLFDAKQSGRGFFNWLGCHWLDLVPYLTQDTVTAVTARVGCFGATAIDVEDGGTVILELAGGTLVTLNGGYWLPRWTGETRISLRSSRRWVHWEPTAPGTGGVLKIHGPQPQFHAMEETFTLPADPTNGYGGNRGVQLIRDWVESARDGENRCRNTVDSAMATLHILDAGYQSSEKGRRITVDQGSVNGDNQI
jgi:predicted dehydrogenase